MRTMYLAMDIGCIECAELSAVIGLYETEEQAYQAIADYLEPGAYWGREDRMGQHREEVFEVEVP
jgi:hypothetical protein